MLKKVENAELGPILDTSMMDGGDPFSEDESVEEKLDKEQAEEISLDEGPVEKETGMIKQSKDLFKSQPSFSKIDVNIPQTKKRGAKKLENELSDQAFKETFLNVSRQVNVAFGKWQKSQTKEKDQYKADMKNIEEFYSGGKAYRTLIYPIKWLNQKVVEMSYNDKGEGSAIFRQLKDALETTLNCISDVAEGKKEINKEEVGAVMVRLSETATAYYETHRGFKWSKEGAERRDISEQIVNITAKFFRDLDRQMGGTGGIEPFKDESIVKATGKKELKEIDYKIKRLDEQYASLAVYYANKEGMEDSVVKDKLLFFQPYEETIRRYKALHQSPDTWPYAIKQYDFYKMQARVLDSLNKNRKKGVTLEDEITAYAREQDEKKEEKKLDPNLIDQGLTPEQLKGLDEIDQWMTRNFNNGGLLGKIKKSFKNNHAEMVLHLFRKTKRERLFIYYLIEKNLRKTPNLMHVFQSQSASYVPNLEDFKDQIMSTKMKFIGHLTGGSYVYMNKIDDALAANESFKDVIQDYSSIYREDRETKEQKEERQKAKEALEPDQRKLVELAEARQMLLKKTFTNFSALYEVTKRAKDTKDKKEKKKLEDQAAELKIQAQADYNSMVILDDEVGEKLEQYKKDHADTLGIEKADYKNKNKGQKPLNIIKEEDGWFDAWAVGIGLSKAGQFSGNAIQKAGELIDKGFRTVGLSHLATWRLSDAHLVDAKFWGGNVIGTELAAIGNVISAIGGIYNLTQNAGGMHAVDIAQAVTNIVKNFGDVAVGIWDAVEKGQRMGDYTKSILEGTMFVQSTALTTAGAVTAGLGMAVNGYQILSGHLNKQHADNAAQLLKKKHETKFDKKNLDKLSPKEREEAIKKERQIRYEKNMLFLSKEYAGNKMTTGAVKVASCAAGLIGVVFPGIGTVCALAGLGLTLLATGMDKTSKIQTQAFDNYFNVEEFYRQVKEKYREKNRTIYNEEAFKDVLRRKLAAAAGYSDVATANIRIGRQYSNMLLDRLFNENEQWEFREKDAYIQMIKGFGLKFDPKKKLPDRDKLARKISGR